MRIYNRNKRAIRDADIVVAIIDGADADSGTAWEMGYAIGLRKTVIALRTDFRRAGSHERVNLMLEQEARVVTRSGTNSSPHWEPSPPAHRGGSRTLHKFPELLVFRQNPRIFRRYNAGKLYLNPDK